MDRYLGFHEIRHLGRMALIAMLALSTAGMLGAQAMQGFEPSGEFEVELAGEELEGLELFHSDRAGAYLIMAPALKSPLLVNTRSRSIEAVSLMKVSKNDDGTIDLLNGAVFDNLGPFQTRHQSLVFNVKGQQMTLKVKPALLGNQKAQSLSEHNPGYLFKSAAYELDGTQMEALKAEKRDVSVKIFFGTWCPVCSRLVPKVMRLEEGLEGSKINFEYYGLPRVMTDDPVTQEMGIKGVPTGIVYVGGKEIGRLTGRELHKPEAAIQKVLSGA